MSLGVNLMVYYATIILGNVGLSAFNIGIVAAVMQTFFALGTYPLPRTIERFGRRGILMWTAFTCGVCLVVFVIMIGIPNPTKATQWVAVASLFVCLFSFGYGWCGVPWIYAAEVSLSTLQTNIMCPFHRKSPRTNVIESRAPQVSAHRWSCLCHGSGRLLL
jgi:MFS family permease